MIYFRMSWPSFLNALSHWEGIPVEGRRLFLEKSHPVQNVDPALFGAHLPALLETGLMELSAIKRWVKLTPQGRSLHRTLTGMGLCKIFEKPGKYAASYYLGTHFTAAALDRLFSITSPWDRERALLQVTTRRRLEQFLMTDDPRQWELSCRDLATDEPLIASGEIFRAMKGLVRELMISRTPVPIPSLLRNRPVPAADIFAAALGACIEYALIFPELRSPDMEPIVGIWPDLALHLGRQRPARLPEPVAARETFAQPFLVEDMTSLLVACSGSPLRLRTQDSMIYHRDAETLGAGLVALPLWIEGGTGEHRLWRIDAATHWVYDLEFVETDNRRDEVSRMVVTGKGAKWLTLTPKARLKAVLDRSREHMREENNPFLWGKYRPTDPFFSFSAGRIEQRREVLTAAVQRLFAAAGGAEMLPLEEFLAYHAFYTNPLLTLGDLREEPLKVLSRESARREMVLNEDDREKLWRQALQHLFSQCLLPLGVIREGVYGSSPFRLAFGLTDIGRYFLGMTGDFEYGTTEGNNIVVQPNFEVVFLAPSPVLEAEIAPFAERKGATIGVLFHITKASIFKAAAAGWTAKRAIDTLQRVSSKDIAENIGKQIGAWFHQCRWISLRKATVAICPDAETALRVLAAGKPHSELLAETVVALWNQKGVSTTIRKLNLQGVFLQDTMRTEKR